MYTMLSGALHIWASQHSMRGPESRTTWKMRTNVRRWVTSPRELSNCRALFQLCQISLKNERLPKYNVIQDSPSTFTVLWISEVIRFLAATITSWHFLLAKWELMLRAYFSKSVVSPFKNLISFRAFSNSSVDCMIWERETWGKKELYTHIPFQY